MKCITAIIFITCSIFFIGSVGAFEQDTITMLQCLVQCGISAGVGYITLKILDK